MSRGSKIAVAAAAGGGVFLFARYALGAKPTEDNTGVLVPPTEAKALAPAVPAAAPGTGAAAATLGAKAVEVLLRNLGAHEEPWPTFPKPPSPMSNRGPLVDQINRGVHNDVGDRLIGYPWCARTVRWAYEMAAKELGLPPPFAGVKSSLAQVTDWKRVFKDYCTSTPGPGMAALILDGKHQHATLVERVDGNTVLTVEGNSADQIAARKRPVSAFATFVDVEAFTRRGAARVAGLDLLGAA